MSSQNQVLNTTWESVTDFCKYLSFKIGNGLLELLIIIGTFFSPAAPVLLAVGLAILLDTHFGVWRAKYDKEKVTSKKLRLGLVPKAIGYALVVLTFFTLDYSIINEFVKEFLSVDYITTKLVGLVLIYIEYTSMDESYKVIKGISLKQAFGNMVKSVRRLIASIIKVKSDMDEIVK